MFKFSRRRALFLSFTCLLTAGACSSPAEDAPEGDAAQASRTQAQIVSDLNQAYADLYAKSVTACPHAHELTTLKRWQQGDAAQDLNPIFREATARQSFDKQRGEQCLTSLQGILSTEDGCTIFALVKNPANLMRGECADLIEGLGQLDDACSFYSECGEGFLCEDDPGSEVCGEGVCKPDPGACAQACAAGEFCDDVDSTEASECKALKAMGDACIVNDACAAGLYCHEQTCQPLSAMKPASSAALAQGEACNVYASRPAPSCEASLLCVGVDPASGDGTCDSPRASGESCFVDVECAGALSCLGRDAVTMQLGTCGEREEIGERCTVNDGCKSGYCASGVCAAKKKAGEACVQGDGSCETRCSDSGVCEEPGGEQPSPCY